MASMGRRTTDLQRRSSARLCVRIRRGHVWDSYRRIKKMGNCASPLLAGVQIFLAVQSWGESVPLPEPPQVRAKNHVVSLTLHAVNEKGRDAPPSKANSETL